MHDRDPRPDDVNSSEAHIAMRKAHREATSSADQLAHRLEEIDIHQREARYLLERAGLLARRRGPAA